MKTKLCSSIPALCVDCRLLPWLSYEGNDDLYPTRYIVQLTRLIKAEFDKLKKGRAMPQQWDNPPDLQIDYTKQYHCLMQTSKGQIEIQLYANAAPNTVNNFVFLANEGFYDGITFHRVITDFMIQGGDPTGSGSGGPGYRFDDEFDGNPHTHQTGSLSMANAGPNTNGSQFFICHGPQPHLDGKHTVFGQVIQGQEVVNAIDQGDSMVKVSITET